MFTGYVWIVWGALLACVSSVGAPASPEPAGSFDDGGTFAPPLYGICYGQFRAAGPGVDDHRSRSEIVGDLRWLRRLTSRIRLYGLAESGRVAVEEASRLGFESILAGIWLSDDPAANEREIAAAIELSEAEFPGLEAFVVGSEVLLRGDLDAETLVSIVVRVREETGLPVAYAENASVWLGADREIDSIASEVDLIVAHVYPFWNGVSIRRAPTDYERTLDRLRARFPEKQVIVGETGWPAGGQWVGAAIPSPANQAKWLKFVLSRSERDSVYYFTAFSEEWKTQHEGGVGAEWGFFASDSRLRPALSALLSRYGVDVAEFDPTHVSGAAEIGATPETLWRAFDQRNDEEVIAIARRIIERDAVTAREQEAASGGPQLDAVGQAFFLLGQSHERRGEIEAAREAYRTVDEQFTRSMAFAEDRATKWSVATEARARLTGLRDH